MASPADSFAAPRVAAGAVFLDDDGRVLLVHPTYKPGWDVPGGYVERGESPATACRREVVEELGLDRPPRRLLSVDWSPDPAGDALLFLFDCGAIGDDEDRIVLQADELDACRWVAEADLAEHCPPRLARRLVATLAADGPYLERGGSAFTPDAGG